MGPSRSFLESDDLVMGVVVVVVVVMADSSKKSRRFPFSMAEGQRYPRAAIEKRKRSR